MNKVLMKQARRDGLDIKKVPRVIEKEECYDIPDDFFLLESLKPNELINSTLKLQDNEEA